MRSNKILEHTADIRLHTEGDTLEELFLAAMEGMADIIKNGTCNKFSENEAKVKETLNISSANPTTLLIDFLSEILTKSHINSTIYCHVKFKKLAETSIKAEIQGKKVDGFDEDIKAVTYHEADIQKNESGNFETIILFDI